MEVDRSQRLEKRHLSQPSHHLGPTNTVFVPAGKVTRRFAYPWSSPVFKPFNANLLFLFSLQLGDIFTFLGYCSQMRLGCVASDLCQIELQMFQRKRAETMGVKQNKLCLKSKKCPNKWEMHQFLWELFSLPLPPVFIFVFLLYYVVQQLVLPHEKVCSKAKVLKDF